MMDDLYKQILDNLPDGVYCTDLKRKITYWNRGSEQVTGYDSEAVVGRHCMDNILVHTDENGVELCKHNCPLAATMRDGQNREALVFLKHADGYRVPVRVKTMPMRDASGEIVGGIELFRDDTSFVSALRRAEDLKKTAMLDSLTGVGNRYFINDQLNLYLTELKNDNTPFGLIFLDIDRFKQVNDRYSHLVGDRVLKLVASTLSHNLRQYDFVGRWGGDEFVVALVDVDEEQANQIAKKLQLLVGSSKLLLENGQYLQVEISYGIALARFDDTIEDILSRADQKLYAMKRQNKKNSGVTDLGAVSRAA